jgi:hypothetical protein
MDDAAGLRDTGVVYVDTNPEQFEALPPTALHRPVDLEVVAADKEGASVFSLMSNAALFNPNFFPWLPDRLCANVHRFTSYYLWQRDWEALRSRHLQPSFHSDSPRD